MGAGACSVSTVLRSITILPFSSGAGRQPVARLARAPGAGALPLSAAAPVSKKSIAKIALQGKDGRPCGENFFCKKGQKGEGEFVHAVAFLNLLGEVHKFKRGLLWKGTNRPMETKLLLTNAGKCCIIHSRMLYQSRQSCGSVLRGFPPLFMPFAGRKERPLLAGGRRAGKRVHHRVNGLLPRGDLPLRGLVAVWEKTNRKGRKTINGDEDYTAYQSKS